MVVKQNFFRNQTFGRKKAIASYFLEEVRNENLSSQLKIIQQEIFRGNKINSVVMFERLLDRMSGNTPFKYILDEGKSVELMNIIFKSRPTTQKDKRGKKAISLKQFEKGVKKTRKKMIIKEFVFAIDTKTNKRVKAKFEVITVQKKPQIRLRGKDGRFLKQTKTFRKRQKQNE